MALTNFAAMQPQDKVYWSRSTFEAARDQMFVNKFLGSGTSAIIQHITDATQSEKGTEVLMNLVADLVGDGVVGDNWREGFEEELQAYWQSINIDLISNAARSKGKLADQKSVIVFRREARDKLANWLAQRVDELAILTLSGISYRYNTNGSLRASSAFSDLAFAADVSAPSARRYLVWDGSNLVEGSNSSITSAAVPKYKMIVDSIAYAKDHHIRPVISGGKEYYVYLVKPGTLAAMKMDPLWQNALVNAGQRGDNNPWFTGATITVDGAVIQESNKVFSTKGAPAGQKWGAGGNVDGTRSLLLGAQALGFADINQASGEAWAEKDFNYGTQKGISLDRFVGFLKPKFYSVYDESVEDFGVLAIDHYLP
jgi:N4-gp56 family major capsid protein